MNQSEDIERVDGARRFPGLRSDLRSASEEIPNGSREQRAAGSPLPVGTSGQQTRSTLPHGRSLSGSSEDATSMQRAMGALKQAMPFVQRLLPLIDGNVVGALTNLISTRANHVPPPAPIDLSPVQNKVSELQLQHLDLRTQVVEQHATLKRVEDRLEMVREATDRNTLEQQELIEDLKSIGNKVNLFAILLFGLLILSVLVNFVLFLHIRKVFP